VLKTREEWGTLNNALFANNKDREKGLKDGEIK